MPRFTAVQISFRGRQVRNIDDNVLIQSLQAGNFFHRHDVDFATEREAIEATQNWTTNGFVSIVEYEVVDAGFRIISTSITSDGRHRFNEPLVFPVDGDGMMRPNVDPQQLAAIQPPVARINAAQSTHTASVHETVTQSLQNLAQRYKKLDIKKNIVEIKRFKQQITTKNFPDTTPIQREAAKRFIDRMDRIFTAKEAGSTFTFEKIIALVWEGMKNCNVPLQTAQEKFIKHLYEIQRGYNMDALGKDNESEGDQPICTGGTINKCVDTLNGGLHDDVFIAYISSETAGEKLKALVKQHTVLFVQNTGEDKEKYLDEIKQLKTTADGQNLWGIPDSILENIKKEVKEEFNNEFLSSLAPAKLDNIFENSFEYVNLNERDYEKCLSKITQDNMMLEKIPEGKGKEKEVFPLEEDVQEALDMALPTISSAEVTTIGAASPGLGIEPDQEICSLRQNSTFFNPGPDAKPAHDERSNNSQNSCFTFDQIEDIENLIKKLEAEIKSFWPYPNKDRKKDKVAGLKQLLVLSRTMSAKEAVKCIEETYPEIRKGRMSTRTAELLDTLCNNAFNPTFSNKVQN